MAGNFQSGEPPQRKREALFIALTGCLLITAGFFYTASRTGLGLAVLVGIFWSFLMMLVFTLLFLGLRRRKIRRKFMLLGEILFWLLPATLIFVNGYRSGLPSAMFQMLCELPAPAYVRDLS